MGLPSIAAEWNPRSPRVIQQPTDGWSQHLPQVIAHRGVSWHFPENTHAAFNAAVELQVDAIETDLQLSADGTIVVCHDPTLARHGRADLHIGTSEFADLADVDIGTWFDSRWKNERLLTLPALLTEFAEQIPLMLEVKIDDPARRDEFIRSLIRDLAPYRHLNSLSVLCFDLCFLERLRIHSEWLKLVWNTKTSDEIERVCRDHSSWLSGVDCRIEGLTPDAVAAVHRYKCQSFCFTCNTATQISKALQLGVGGLIGDCPETIRRYLSEGQRNAG